MCLPAPEANTEAPMQHPFLRRAARYLWATGLHLIPFNMEVAMTNLDWNWHIPEVALLFFCPKNSATTSIHELAYYLINCHRTLHGVTQDHSFHYNSRGRATICIDDSFPPTPCYPPRAACPIEPFETTGQVTGWHWINVHYVILCSE